MDANEIISMISTIGFPIVACVFMWKYNTTTLKEVINTINENTRMISKLCEKLEGKHLE